jgi:hypothetical protein
MSIAGQDGQIQFNASLTQSNLYMRTKPSEQVMKQKAHRECTETFRQAPQRGRIGGVTSDVSLVVSGAICNGTVWRSAYLCRLRTGLNSHFEYMRCRAMPAKVLPK